MPLRKAEVEIPFTGGMATKPSAEGASPDSTLREIKGYRFGEIGRLQRLGKYGISTHAPAGLSGDFPSDDQPVRTLARRAGEAFGVSDNYGVARIPQESNADVQWLHTPESAGTAVSDQVRYIPMPAQVEDRWGVAGQTRYGAGFSSGGVAVLSDSLAVVAWSEVTTNGNTRIMMAAHDPRTQERHSDTVETYITLSPPDEQCLHVERLTATTAVVTWVYSSGAPYTIYGTTYDATTRRFATPVTLTTDGKTSSYGVRPSFDAGEFMFGFTENSTGDTRVQSRTLGSVSNSWFTSVYGADDGVDFAVIPTAYPLGSISDNTFVLSWVTGTLRLAKLNSLGSPDTVLALTIITGSTFKAATVAETEGSGTGPMMIVAELNHGTSVRSLVHFEASDPAVGSITTKGLQHHARLLGKAFKAGYYGHYLAQVSDENNLTSVALVRAYTPDQEVAVARIFHEVSTLRDSSFLSYAWSVGVNGETVHACVPCGLNADAGYGTLGSSVRVCSIAMLGDSLPNPYVEDRARTIVAGGLVWTYDGVSAFPSSPLRRPHEPNVTLQAGSTTATFAVCAVYTWIDSKGLEHRSAPSASVTTSPSSQQVNVSIDLLPFGAHKYIDDTSLNIEVYATENGGSVFYLTTYTSLAVGNGEVTFQEVVPGASSAKALYTDGGELPADPPAPMVNVVRVQDRLVGLDAEDRTLVRFTKPLVEGFAPEWSSLNTIMIGDKGVAVFEHAGEIGVLCRNGVWKVSGVGPNANGQGTFAPPYRLPVELEGVSAQSVVQTPLGTMFLARHGVMLLSTGGELQFVGLPVQEDLNANRVTVRRASYWAQANEVRLLVDDSSTSNGRTWMFNIVESKWSYEDNNDSGSVERFDEVFVGEYGYAASSESGYDVLTFAPYELDGTEDASGHNQRTGEYVVDTHYFKPDGLTGRGRVWRVDVAFACDGPASTTAIQTDLYDLADGETGSVLSSHRISSGGVTWSTNEVHWISLHPKTQKVAGLRVKIAITDSSTARAGVIPLAVRVKYGRDPNAARSKSDMVVPFVAS